MPVECGPLKRWECARNLGCHGLGFAPCGCSSHQAPVLTVTYWHAAVGYRALACPARHCGRAFLLMVTSSGMCGCSIDCPTGTKGLWS